MSTISRGFTFTDGSLLQCSYTALNALVNNATVTSIPLSEFSNEARVVQISATTPGTNQGSGSLWFDSTLNMLRVSGLAGWNVPEVGPDLDNLTGSAIPKGAWVVPSGSSRVAPGVTAKWPELIGVCTATIADGSHGLVQSSGFIPAICLGPVTAGDNLIFSGISGCAMSATFGGSLTVTMGVDIGMALGNLSGTSTGLVTCMVFAR